MTKLGIIGGAGPLASALFYETLIHESYQRKQTLPEILLLNYPFTRGLTSEESRRSGSISREELLHCLQALEVGGATLAVLVCNTLHLELARVPHGSVHLLRVPDCVLEEISRNNGKRLLLLGTQTTCNSSLYNQTGMTLLCPPPETQCIVDQVIDRVLEGKILAEDSHLIAQVISHFPEEIDGVILGCTDLPVLHHHFPIHSTQPIYDSVKISAKTLLRHL